MDKIFDFMSSPVLSIDAQSTVEQGAKYMGEKNVDSLLVKENDDYVGILTTSDMVTKLVAKGLDPKSTKVLSIMSKPLLTLDHYISRSEANEFMLKNKIKHLVVTKHGKVSGILTMRDMVSGGTQQDALY